MRLLVRLLAVIMGVLVAVSGGGQSVAGPSGSGGGEHDARAESFDGDLTVENKTFYPLVVDKFRDHAIATVDDYDDYYRNVRATVYNDRGRLIRTIRGNYQCDFDEDWCEWVMRWNGKKADGTLAKKGQYRLVVTAKNYDGQNVEGERTLALAGGVLNRRFVTERVGTGTVGRPRTGNGCYFAKDSNKVLELGCWRGTSVSASWRFKVHPNATKIRPRFWGMPGTTIAGN